MRPFILTKEDVQKTVFGAGYKSLPTYTVEEFFDQQVALGNFPDPRQVMQWITYQSRIKTLPPFLTVY